MRRLKFIISAFLILCILGTALSQCGPKPSAPAPTTIPTVTTTPPETTVPPETTLPPETTVPPTTVPPVTAPPTETHIDGVTAKSAFAYDCSLNSYLYLKGDLEADIYPASITKLFTSYMVLQYLEPTDMITVGSIIETVPYDSSFAGLEKGDVISVSDLLHGMIMRSGGDAARVLAVAAGRVIAGDPKLSEKAAMTRFMDDMNEKAPSLGLVNSHFVTADGYHDKAHHTCLADIVTISIKFLNDPLLRKIASTPRYTGKTAAGRELEWFNTNFLVDPERNYYVPTAIGMKTGNTRAAGRCLVSAFLVDGNITIVGVFGCANKEDHFINARTVYYHYYD